MPINQSEYKPPFWMRNGHIATIVPSAFRKINGIVYSRERLITPDDDFVDIDWNNNGKDKLVIISHGLEGSSGRPYVLGMASWFGKNGWDALAWNCRSCSGEINKQARFYHHGETEDMKLVVNHAIKKGYKNIFLVGFSMGGSITLKYLGEHGNAIPHEIIGGSAFSVPVNLTSSVKEFRKPGMRLYRKRFLRKLENKVRLKAEQYPELIEYKFDDIRYFADFDNRYTAPLHGFRDARDFYLKASAENYMAGTKVPTLLVNALNDPFLTGPCYPYDVCKNHDYLYLETPKYGGHVGFTVGKNNDVNYMEKRALEFAEQQL